MASSFFQILLSCWCHDPLFLCLCFPFLLLCQRTNLSIHQSINGRLQSWGAPTEMETEVGEATSARLLRDRMLPLIYLIATSRLSSSLGISFQGTLKLDQYICIGLSRISVCVDHPQPEWSRERSMEPQRTRGSPSTSWEVWRSKLVSNK